MLLNNKYEINVLDLFPYSACLIASKLSHCPICPSVEEQIECPAHPEVSTQVPAKRKPSVATEQPVTQSPTPIAAVTVATPVAVPAAAVESVDLGKIGSILNSLNSVIKNTGECWLVS